MTWDGLAYPALCVPQSGSITSNLVLILAAISASGRSTFELSRHKAQLSRAMRRFCRTTLHPVLPLSRRGMHSWAGLDVGCGHHHLPRRRLDNPAPHELMVPLIRP